MSDGVAGAGSAHRQGYGETDTAAPKGKTPGAQTSGTPNTQDPPSEGGKLACGIAGMGSADPVVHLPDLPLAETAIFPGANASISSQGAGGTCVSESARPVAPPAGNAEPKRPAAPAQNVDAAPAAWKQQITDRLSLCYTAEDFVAVLKELTDPEQQRFVVDCALRRIIDPNAIRDLAQEVKGSPGLRTIVARQLLKYAAHPEALSPGYHQRGKEFTSSWAAGVLVALPQNELGAFLSSQPKDDGARFALALGGEHSWRNISSTPELARLHRETARLIDRVLAALNEQPTTPTTGTIVRNLCGQILSTDFYGDRAFERPPLSPQNVAMAIARSWHPNDPVRAEAATTRMQGLLADRRGSRLMFEGPSSWRVKLVFEVVCDEPGITAQTFANYDGDPMRHPIVTRALARELVSITNGVTVPTPAQAAAAEDAVGRISDVLQIDAGQNLISGPAPVKAELEAWAHRQR